MSEQRTHFGFEEVPVGEKQGRVRGVFDSVADRYDLMNDLMSFGLHRIWKRFTAGASRVRPGHRVLDLAGGTGDLTRLLARRVGEHGTVVLADINGRMLERGRDRLTDAGLVAATRFVQADAESLPFPADSFHCVTMAFGLRNVTRMERALDATYRVLRPGGQALILEFSRLTLPALQPLYDAYSFRVLPGLGRLVAGDADSYRYLAESIRRHPDQDQLRHAMEAVGFERVTYFNLLGGVVSLHRGYKL